MFLLPLIIAQEIMIPLNHFTSLTVENRVNFTGLMIVLFTKPDFLFFLFAELFTNTDGSVNQHQQLRP